MTTFVHPTATVEEPTDLGDGTSVWHHVHVQAGARIGRNCTLGHAVFVAGGARLGDRVKVQNHVSIYAGVDIEDDVFLGPGCVFCNVKNPRAAIDRHAEFMPTFVRRGATIGANATILPGVVIGRHAFVAAGATVTKSVADYALVVGSPARLRGFMSRHGQRLFPVGTEIVVCPEGGLRYRLDPERGFHCLDLDEDAPLPAAREVRREVAIEVP